MLKRTTFSVYLYPLKYKMNGFNLVEVMITLTIAGILAAAAAPSFKSFIASQRVKTASFDLISALTQTRSEAIKRNVNFLITATGGSWQSGWTVCLPDTTDPTICKSGVTSLSAQSAYKSLAITELSNKTNVTFRGDGRQPTTASSVKFTINASPTVSGVSSRCVSLSLSGQASSTTGACS